MYCLLLSLFYELLNSVIGRILWAYSYHIYVYKYIIQLRRYNL